MFLLGHLGIGSKIVSPWTKNLSKKAVLLGTILPDLVDKPLYYGLSAMTGKWAADLGLISGTRTFGHTALFALAITLIAVNKRSKVLAAVALGIASHLLLDSVSDLLQDHLTPPAISNLADAAPPLLWPFTSWKFPAMPFNNSKEHLSFWNRPVLFGGEALGLLILLWDFKLRSWLTLMIGPVAYRTKRRPRISRAR